jgi:hypothetical protein
MNFAIGRRIVDHEQAGEKRAAYGQRVLESFAEALTSEFGRKFSKRNLNLMRQLYLAYKSQGEQVLLSKPFNFAVISDATENCFTGCPKISRPQFF